MSETARSDDTQPCNSALYIGETWHQRFVPKPHKFKYNIMMFWLDLDETRALTKQLRLFSVEKFNWIQYRRSDFLNNTTAELKQEALQTMSELAGKTLTGKVYLLSPLRILGMYFSPVNFYYLEQADGQFSHMLAEVSNTPWNERHCYLVDLEQQAETEKAFHVSPFNPIDMQYRWNISPPGDSLHLKLDCIKSEKHFTAAIALQKQRLTNKALSKSLWQFPHITLKTLTGIYWQALKLFVKRVPIYDHPGKSG